MKNRAHNFIKNINPNTFIRSIVILICLGYIFYLKAEQIQYLPSTNLKGTFELENASPLESQYLAFRRDYTFSLSGAGIDNKIEGQFEKESDRLYQLSAENYNAYFIVIGQDAYCIEYTTGTALHYIFINPTPITIGEPSQ